MPGLCDRGPRLATASSSHRGSPAGIRVRRSGRHPRGADRFRPPGNM